MTESRPEPHSCLVEDLHVGPAVTVEARESLWDAWHLMFVSGLRHLAVLGDSGRVAGVLSDRTILTDLPLTEAHLAGRKVEDVMATPGTVTPSATAHDAAELMSRGSVDALPVVGDDGRLRGLLTSSDLVAWLATA